MRKIKAFFDALYNQYNRRGLLHPDPLEFLHRWPDVREREVGALLAACFAYGNVKAILKNLQKLFAIMPLPRTYILAATPQKLRRDFKHFKYRFTTAQELADFLLSIQRILRRYGSLEACFTSGLKDTDRTACPALKNFAAQLRQAGAGGSLVPDPQKGSALKRLNLFLRWLVRQDEVDPGGWQVPPRLLIVPLDVHMHRCARWLGLTKRNSADMKTALEITRSLARFCPQDPVKYDFCITRFGIHPDLQEETLNANSPRTKQRKSRKQAPCRTAKKQTLSHLSPVQRAARKSQGKTNRQANPAQPVKKQRLSPYTSPRPAANSKAPGQSRPPAGPAAHTQRVPPRRNAKTAAKRRSAQL